MQISRLAQHILTFCLTIVIATSFWSCSTKEENPVLAQFDGGDIRTDEYVDYFLASTKYKPDVLPTKENLQEVVLKLGLEKMALLEGIEQGIEQDSMYVESYRNNLRKTLFFKYMRLEIIDRVITDSLVRTYYDQFSPQYHMKYIMRPVLQSSSDAFAQSQRDSIYYVYRQLEAGADFEEMAKQFSQDITSNYKGGSLGFVVRESVGDAALRAAMDTLDAFHYSQPIRGYEGYYILFKGETREVQVPPYEEAYSKIWQSLYRTRRHEIEAVLQQRFAQLAERYNFQWKTDAKPQLIIKAGGTVGNAPTAPLNFDLLTSEDMATVLATYDDGVVRAYELFEEKNRAPGNLLEFDERLELIAQRHLLSQHAKELQYDELPEIQTKMRDVRESLIRSILHRREVIDKAEQLMDFVETEEQQAGVAEDEKPQFRRVSTQRRIREDFEQQLQTTYNFKFVSRHFNHALALAEQKKRESLNEDKQTSNVSE